ncbi:toxin VasX [Pseudomonas indica]|uniref:toxin VasX n=1 Tax=Pseudomonas indica TaxID=137658 RepID=UPI0023F633B9|nr:toxin VasX [Pseudomonas indica]MBU3056396.1 hypothetical protein [Pseudomonas indica]
MTDWMNTRAVRLAKADRDAKATFEKEDLASPVGACPARQAELYIVPARYALAEHPAEHACVKPACEAKSHAMALRRLRAGFLYLWHHEGPLKRYAVAYDGLLTEQPLDEEDTKLLKGSQTGIALDKRHDAWLMYSEIPLPEAAYSRLANDESERRRHMHRIALTEVALNLEATHCPPLQSAEQVLAELMPEVREWALAHDYAINGDQHRKDVEALGKRASANPSRENIDAYTHTAIWLGEAEQAAARNPQAANYEPGEWSAEKWDIPGTDGWLMQARSQAGALWAVFATLDDDLGVLRDLNHEQELTESRHERWLGDNAQRTAIAGFIRSLTRVDGAEVADMLNYRYREHNIALTPEQGETMLDVRQKLQTIRYESGALEREHNPLLSSGSQRDPYLVDERIMVVSARQEEQLSRIRPFLPLELQPEALAVVNAYRRDKVDNLSGGHGTAQIAERIALWKMDDWLDNQAPAHYAYIERRHDVLYADRQRFMPRHEKGTWFVDHRLPEHQDWLGKLAHACLSALCVREQGATHAYDLLRDTAGAGVFSLLIKGWSPSLGELLNDGTRLGELENALSADNLADTRTLLGKLLDPAEVAALTRLAGNLQGAWAQTVTRLGAGIVKLAGEDLKPLMGLLLILRLGDTARFTKSLVEGSTVWNVTGQLADNLKAFTHQVAEGLRKGTLKQVQRWEGAKQAGGVLPLAVLALNIANAHAYSRGSEALEAEGEQRQAERLSAYLYTGAALCSAMQNFVLVGMGRTELSGRLGTITVTAPTLTLFGGFIGVFSATAAAGELVSLQKQISQAQASIDPYMDLRRSAVGGQVLFYGSQGVLGFTLTAMRMAGTLTTAEAIQYFRLGMAPLNWLLLAAGGIYLYAWWQQETGLQTFLSQCCWTADVSRRRWDDSPEGQNNEFMALLQLLYSPQVQANTVAVPITGARAANLPSARAYESALNSLTIALPAALPGSTDVAVRIFSDGDRGHEWADSLQASWIPADEGQGLLLTGRFRRPAVYLEVQIAYRSSLTLLSGAQSSAPIIGGPQGMRFAISSDGLVTPLYADDPAPRLERCEFMRLSAADLTPRGERQ